ncbi:sugar ABC transporter substrate-binding protein [Oceanithermus desulfurans]|uniref:Maltose ABC transporter substrate-binding protein n=2 Tax=Oceanithermus desulfurans TaxID=227924 RepID=A0A511RPJ9_9DEIN|nr:maltose ABC transporter substrate-binding protein [Oceanithermus desulfurans]MBB6030042.1 arabinogalactan oligomer/maltooligosaccharide transport system substrate-binding protein [Oceanithermus desulfurans]GEM90706.1 maltose ABC transporter substrate-binding protein [Oceanithermus desulfurans NBRC 100063]
MKKLWMAALVLLMGVAMAAGQITVWTHFGGPELEFLKDQAQRYEKATGVGVQVVEVPFGDIKQKFILGAPQGEAADLVVTVPHDWVGEMAAAGVLEPVGKYATQDYLSGLMPVAVDAFSYGGKLFGLPMNAESVALIYNKDLVQTPPATWDEFLALAKKYTTGDTFGFLYDLGNPYFNYGWFKAYGAYVFGKNPDGSLNPADLGLGGEPGYKAGQFIKDLRYKYELIPEGVDYGVADGAFKDGVLAMILNGPWALGDYKKAGLNFGIAPLPAPPGGDAWGPFVGVQGVVVNAYSKNKIAAVNFAKALVSPANQVAFNKAGGRIPVSLGALEQLKDDPVVKGFSTTIAMGDPMPNIPAMGKVWGPWGNALALITQKPDSDVKKIIDDMVAEIEKAIKGQ